MFVVTIVLVNLLIAQMSAHYEEMSEQGERLQLTAQVRLFNSHLLFTPPYSHLLFTPLRRCASSRR